MSISKSDPIALATENSLQEKVCGGAKNKTAQGKTAQKKGQTNITGRS
jgi:hypothetical protein